MSSPPNALDAYRSYSYHHILIAADSTDTAHALSEENKISRFEHPDVKFCPQEYKGGKYVVLINGITDSQFVIQSAKWSTVPIPTIGSATASRVTSVQTMAVDGEIEILEPQGINFFNVLVNITRMLKIDPSLIAFVLKTVFVGHRHDGETTLISNIKPLLFMMVDINAAIEVSGATYNMSLVGIANGAAKLPHVNAIVSGLSMHIEGTLDNAFKTLTTKITGVYDRMWEKVVKPGGCGVSVKAGEFTKVRYEFDLDDSYKPLTAGNQMDPKYADSTKEGGYASNLGESSSIENIITTIMLSSEDVVNQAKGKLPDERFMFKISSSVRTDAQKDEFIVTFHINKFKAVVVPTKDFLTFTPPAGSGITFDYIFTGKNIDIVDMDIKMEYGLMFFQVLAAEGTSATSALELLEHYNPDTFVKASGSPQVFDDDGSKTLADCAAGAGKGKIRRPMFLGTSLKHPMFRDTKELGPSASFNAMLNRHAAIENLGVKVKIRGNPQLLSDTTQLPEDLYTNVAKVPPLIVPPDGDATLVEDLSVLFPEIHKTPAYVKINVFAPHSWSGQGQRTEGGDVIPASYQLEHGRNLWYDGWYYVIQIDNVFDNGEFTQEMDLLSLPTEIPEQEADPECQKIAAAEQQVEATTPSPKSPPKTPPSKEAISKVTGSTSQTSGSAIEAGSGNPVTNNSGDNVDAVRRENIQNNKAGADEHKWKEKQRK